jgi:hypothetical protein
MHKVEAVSRFTFMAYAHVQERSGQGSTFAMFSSLMNLEKIALLS